MKARDRETRDRLLDAAARLFASRGFKRVTVRDICRDARANVAAVNYHFGDKMGLYREVLRTAVEAMRSTLQTAQAAGHDSDADAKLRAYVRVFLERVVESGPDSWIHRLMWRELTDPTPALDLIVQQAIRPRLAYLCTLVGELLARPSDDVRVTRCAHSVHALCISMIPNPVSARLYPEAKMTPAAVAALADHIASFSLAGIRATAGRTEKAARPRRRPGEHARFMSFARS
jgi:TetR/AcrR family transcriptional regulator, regulator of cefoperazone and chloramphenicol sensitivity